MSTQHDTENYAGFAAPYDQNLISETEYNHLRTGLLPQYARKWIVKEFGGVPSRVRRQLMEVASQEPYHPQIAISIVFGVIASHKSLEKWKAANLRKSHQSISVSSKVNGKWNDLETCLWPPYERPATRSGLVNNTVYHRPARYIFKHGSIRVDLGAQDGKYSPILHNNPNSALQSVATRLGRSIGGDFNRVAQQIVGDTDLIATSTAMRVGNQWIVLITMMRDPKLTPASFHVTMEGTVKTTDENHPANSVSEVEYALIKGIIEEDDSEQSMNYCYEFDGDHQAQMMVEAMSDNLDTETMSPTELLVMELAAENGDLIDFMSGSPTYQSQDYHDIINMRVEQTAMRLIKKYDGNVEKAFYVARMMHNEQYDALEDTQAYCYTEVKEKPLFQMKGSTRTVTTNIMGVSTTYEKHFMPAPNPFSQTKFLASTLYVAPVQKFSEPVTSPAIPSKTISHIWAKPESQCVNALGQRGIAPAKQQKQFSLRDYPRLDAIVSAMTLTGSLPKALKIAKRKESFA